MPLSSFSAVPHFITALTGPLLELEQHFLANQTDIERWFRLEWQHSPAPFYASVDLRNAGFKVAPVDTNLFPAGFNNLNPAFLPLCVQAVQAAIEQIDPGLEKILIIAENHTRNLFYLESLCTLQDILQLAGYETRMSTLRTDAPAPQHIILPSGRTLRLDPLQVRDHRVSCGDFIPCIVLLNNDLSAGIPSFLTNLTQHIIPPLALGWTHRRKSAHFTHYSAVAREFAQQVDIDPWLVDPLFKNCGQINFMQRVGEDCLADNVQALLTAIQRKYTEYEVSQPPFVILKADAGTYGMGVMTVYSPDDVRSLNRKQRTRMASTKEGLAVTNVILQEGVYSFETWGAQEAVAEPVVYMINHAVVGGFYRVHTQRRADENLNAPGMSFEPLAFADSCITPDQSQAPDAVPNRFYAYGVIARLALLAAAREYREHTTTVAPCS